MPQLRAREIVDRFLEAFFASGGNAVLVSGLTGNPRQFAVTAPSGDLLIWIYAWTVTSGGRSNLPNEMRIQLTSVSSPLPLNPDGPTALMGFEANTGTFAGFDLDRHRTFTLGSPSVQISTGALNDALTHGFGFDEKGNREIAIGIRPDHLLAYIGHAALLHRQGGGGRVAALLRTAAQGDPLPATEMRALSTPRQRLVQEVSKWSRDGRFRQQVLLAYDHRCAVTRMKLALVEAAHILPVKAPGSPDDVRNGLALSPTMHRALDSGLIFLTRDRELHINPRRRELLQARRLLDGLPLIERHLGRVFLPPDRRQWPDPDLIDRANRYRGIPT